MDRVIVRVIVHHRHEWARGTKVAGLQGRMYVVSPVGALRDGDQDVHPDDAAEFKRFAVFDVRKPVAQALPTELPPPIAPVPAKAPPPPPAPVDLPDASGPESDDDGSAGASAVVKKPGKPGKKKPASE
jgi:hypothetical protein